ncbi:ABC transporter substrate-binding protein, partial [Ruminococcus callidus]
NSKTSKNADAKPTVAYKDMQVGETATDLKADLKILTNRTDLVDSDFQDYISEFNAMYPNITITYEGITDYDTDATTRLSSGDWGDICCIPTTVDKSELSNYFEKIGDYGDFKDTYEFADKQMFNNEVYGIPTMGNVSGVVYNKAVFEKAGITELPTDPETFLADLKLIQEKTDAIPLYTNYAAGWTLTAWDAYISGGATGDADFKNNKLVHSKDPFAKHDDMTGPFAVYDTLYEAVKQGLTEEDPTTTDWEGCKAQINEGNIGCMVLGSWAVPQMQAGGPNADDIAYMPFPISVDGKQYASASADYCYGVNVNSTSEEKTAAMLYIKWLTESSGFAKTQGGIPIVKGDAYPDSLESFQSITLVTDNPAPAGEEDLFGKINNDSEISLDSDSTHVASIIEAAIGGNQTMEEIADEWNAAWTSAQEKNGVTPE